MALLHAASFIIPLVNNAFPLVSMADLSNEIFNIEKLDNEKKC